VAGDAHSVDIGNDDLLPPWSDVFDVIEATDTNEWILVGGLMVQLHALRASIPPPRATKDVDLVVDVAANSASVAAVAIALKGIGFEPIVPTNRNEPIYRFQRAAEQVDLMVADHLPARLTPRFMMRPAFAVTAGEQSLRRRDAFVLTSTTSGGTNLGTRIVACATSAVARRLYVGRQSLSRDVPTTAHICNPR
jgi:hypothetical protein